MRPFGLSLWVLVHDSLVYTLTERLYCTKTLESRDSLTKPTISGRSMQTNLFSGIWIASRTPDQLKGCSIGRGNTCLRKPSLFDILTTITYKSVESKCLLDKIWIIDLRMLKGENIYIYNIYTMKNKKMINNIDKYYSFENKR